MGMDLFVKKAASIKQGLVVYSIFHFCYDSRCSKIDLFDNLMPLLCVAVAQFFMISKGNEGYNAIFVMPKRMMKCARNIYIHDLSASND